MCSSDLYPVSPSAGAAALLTYKPSDSTELRYGIYDINNNLQLDTYGENPDTPLSNLQGTLQVLQVQHRWPAADRRLKRRQVPAQLPDGLLQIGGFLSATKATPLALALPLEGNGASVLNAATTGEVFGAEAFVKALEPLRRRRFEIGRAHV